MLTKMAAALCFSSFLFASSVSAAILCPAYVICHKDKDVSSCVRYGGGDTWVNKVLNDGDVEKGIYDFSHAAFHVKGYVYCYYARKGKRFTKLVFVPSIPELKCDVTSPHWYMLGRTCVHLSGTSFRSYPFVKYHS